MVSVANLETVLNFPENSFLDNFLKFQEYYLPVIYKIQSRLHTATWKGMVTGGRSGKGEAAQGCHPPEGPGRA